MNKIIHINNYSPSGADKFFFDTNIWMFLYCPIGNYEALKVKKYSTFFKKIIDAGSTIFISSLIFSEFINSYAHLDFELLNKKSPQKYKKFKKDYKNTIGFEKVIDEISINVKKILNLGVVQKIEDKFGSIDIAKLFYNNKYFDFNDRYYQELSQLENFKIVTDDRHFAFSKTNARVITANEKLLKNI